jgi:hypothetical protein
VYVAHINFQSVSLPDSCIFAIALRAGRQLLLSLIGIISAPFFPAAKTQAVRATALYAHMHSFAVGSENTPL